MSYDDGGMGDWKPNCSKCFRPEGFVCRCKEIELGEENERLKKKLSALADEASRCRGSLIQAGHFLLATWRNVHHENLLKAITEAREEEEKRE